MVGNNSYSCHYRWTGTLAGKNPNASFDKGDINKDCYVNLMDLMLLANDWLKCTDPADPVNCVLD